MYSNVFFAVRESLDFDFGRFLPSSFATFSARLADAEPPSIIIGKRSAPLDLIKAEPNQVESLDLSRVCVVFCSRVTCRD